MKLSLSIAPRSVTEARAIFRANDARGRLVEVRVDAIRDLDLPTLLRPPRPAVIITNRRRGEGGMFRGDAREQVALLGEALALGAEYVDVELSYGVPAVRRLSARCPDRVICSHHDFTRTADDLGPVYDRCRSTGAGIIKLALAARGLGDMKAMIAIMARARGERQKIIGISMGEYGQPTRVLGGAFGGWLSYGVTEGAEATGPGQLSIGELTRTFRAERIGRRTKIFGLLGNPVRFSRGTAYHNARFRRGGCDAVYVNFLSDDAEEFIRTFGDLVTGVSVTMPFKSRILPFLDAVEGEAGSVKAVNTVLRRRGRLLGCNTDVPAIRALLRSWGSASGKRVLVLGTGAMASAMTHVVSSAGAQVTVLGRTRDRARRLAARYSCAYGAIGEAAEHGADIVMNGTPIGMGSSDAAPVPRSLWHRGMLVVDAVAAPPGTRMVREARAAGCAAITGAELFERQAMLQSKMFMESCR